jgi:hypothetical protein
VRLRILTAGLQQEVRIVTLPGLDKLVRLGVMAEMLLAKARRAPRD